MVFCAIRPFHDALLLLELFLNAPSLSHAGRKRHRSNCENSDPQLQSDERLIFRFSNERTEATQRSPHRDHGQDENAHGSFAWTKAKGRPNHDGAANESNRVISGRNFKPPAKNNAAEQHQQQKKHADFGGFLPTPTSSESNAPEYDQRSENKVTGCISQPPSQPDCAVVCPIGKASEGKAGDTKRRTDDGARRCYKRKFEYVLGTTTEVFPARESDHQPRAHQRLQRVAC